MVRNSAIQCAVQSAVQSVLLFTIRQMASAVIDKRYSNNNYKNSIHIALE